MGKPGREHWSQQSSWIYKVSQERNGYNESLVNLCRRINQANNGSLLEARLILLQKLQMFARVHGTLHQYVPSSAQVG